MIRTFRLFAAGLVAALGFSLPASAATGGTDFTDNWLLPGEQGWGLNLIHQGNLIFATLFVYDVNGQPHFFSGSETVGTSTTSFSGPLYETRGTYFAQPYNQSTHTATQVGTISLNFSSANNGTLSYNVSGVTVTKAIQRFAFRNENLAGNYLGGLTASSVCGGSSQLTLIFDTIQVTHSGSSVSFKVNFFNGSNVASSCTFNGTYSQNGRLGNVSGTYSCTFGTTPGNAGSFTISQIDAQQTGFTGRFTGSDNFCSSHTGYFGGVRDVI
jgi:hypothetical protein